MINLNYPQYYRSGSGQVIGWFEIDLDVLPNSQKAVPPQSLGNQQFHFCFAAHLRRRRFIARVQDVFDSVWRGQNCLDSHRTTPAVHVLD